MEIKEKNPLGYEKPSLLLRKFAVPSVIAMLVSSLYNLIDQICIGQWVNYLGNGATNVAFPLTTICLSISLLVGVGSAAKFSLSLGQGNKDEAEKCVGNGLSLVLILGILYTVLVEIFLTPLLQLFGATPSILPNAISYAGITSIGMPFLIFTNVMSNLIRADGSPKYSMACMVVGAIINTILDPVFILCFDMGISGAAIATTISQIISFIMSAVYIPKFKQIKLKKTDFRLNIKRCFTISSLGISNCCTQLAITLIQIVINNSLTYYGKMSFYGEDIPLSAFGVVMKINAIFISFFVGISQGAQPIVGFNYGAKQYDRVKKIYKLSIQYSFVISVIAFIAFQFFPSYIISIFGIGDELYMEFAVKCMRILLFMIIINGVQIISSNFFAAIGKPLKGLVLSLSRQCLLLIPLMLILPLFMQLDGIMYSAPIADLTAFVISVIMIKVEFKKMT